MKQVPLPICSHTYVMLGVIEYTYLSRPQITMPVEFLCLVYFIVRTIHHLHWRRTRLFLMDVKNIILVIILVVGEGIVSHLSTHYIIVIVSVFKIKRSKGASATRARGVLMVKILNKCILSIVAYNLILDRHCNLLYTPRYFHTPVYLAVFVK